MFFVPSRSRPTGVRGAVVLAVLSLLAALALVLPTQAYAAPPPNPSDEQIAQAESAQSAAAEEVGRLSALVSQAETELRALATEAEIATEAHHLAEEQLQAATAEAARASAAADQAAADVGTAQEGIAAFARGSYIQGSTLDNDFMLLDASGPAELIERAGLLASIADNHLSALTEVRLARVAQANADSRARRAVLDQQSASAAAAAALADAEGKVARAQAQTAAVQAQQATYQGELQQAQQALLGVQGARVAYDDWAAQEAERQAEADRRAEQARRAAAAAPPLAAPPAADPPGTAPPATGPPPSRPAPAPDPGPSNPSPPPAPDPPAPPAPAPSPPPSGGGWTAAKGEQVVSAALEWEGLPYAYGGGDYRGPSWGIGSDSDVWGFDCSGLTQWAWYQAGIMLPRTSATQYSSGGQHVDSDDLLPGDLVFWDDGGPIHHVAIWMGDGMIFHAPHSGAYLEITTMWWSGYAGAVRPGT